MSGIMRRINRVFLIVGLIFGIAMLGLGHVPLGHSSGPDLTAYAMPDGKLPQLCITDADAGQSNPVHKIHCPACHLAAQLPAQDVVILATWALAPCSAQRRDTHLVRGQIGAPNVAEARAPPAPTV